MMLLKRHKKNCVRDDVLVDLFNFISANFGYTRYNPKGVKDE